ncbi:peptidylprolyl isomerase [Rhodobacteraceae bacterium RKSG542]|uniref:peptidylprolyl isomerase n=1 Tax=Pseudovibrio flavus TaxID=2529854 RepID=UPI0012BB71F8|nr:peptidylprolyl isomerase [Pseudovibrio flavus]MTI15778.1 peptidylprolyl isomerase [Pseudovibrio flavus]
MVNIYKNPTLETQGDCGCGSAERACCKADTSRPLSGLGEVEVNGKSIAEEDIMREAQHHPSDSPGGALAEAARALVIRELLLQEAARLGVRPSDHEDDEEMQQTDEEALISALLEQEVIVPSASEVECKRFYENNPQKFSTSPLYEARHILLIAHVDDSAKREEQRQKAEELVAVLKAEPHRFGEFAAEYSACNSAKDGGRLGQITRGDTAPAFEKALDAMDVGSMSQYPIETQFGFHVIALDNKEEGRLLPYEQVQSRISEWLEAGSWTKAVSQYIGILAGLAEIKGIELEKTMGPLVQ